MKGKTSVRPKRTENWRETERWKNDSLTENIDSDDLKKIHCERDTVEHFQCLLKTRGVALWSILIV